MHSTIDDRVWLAWLVKVRILILTVLLGIELAIVQFTPVLFPMRLFVDTILLAYTISAFYLVLLRLWNEPRAQSVLQVISDLLLVSLLVYITGGVDSSLNFLYPLVIVVAAILLPRTWAYLTSALAFLLYGTVLELCYFQIVPSYSVTHPGIRTLQGIIFVNLFGYLAIAYLAGLLASKLRQADKRLEYTRGELLSLQALHENIIRSTGRGAVGHVYTLDDLTQLRRLEREVRMQDRLAAVGRLSAAIAHEVRNPLTSIAGSASLLSEMPDLNEEHRRLLQIVTRESERLNGIITDFLAYSRTKQYHFANVDMVPLLEDTLTLLGHRLNVQNTGIKIERRYSAKTVFAQVDGDRMKQVFWNFCENAVRAMKKGGTLTVSIEEMGSEWQFSFADTGPGMSPQMVEKVFEPFQSQFEGGTGLGLAIVYQIVQAHEGKVWVRSKPGQGCTFVLRVRRAAENGAIVATTENTRVIAEPVAERLIGEGAHA